MRYSKPTKCDGHGCKYKSLNFACLVKHGNVCIKKMRWLNRQGYLTDRMLKVNIKHIKKMGFKQY